MPKKKSRRSSPQKRQHRKLRHWASHAFLYRWSSWDGKEEEGGYAAHGALPQAQADEAMRWALEQSECWLVTFIACFVTPDREYYEEQLDIGPLGPVKMGNPPEEIKDIFRQAQAQATAAGNPNHYVDTVTVLTLHTPKMARRFDSDTWLKNQAGRRANQILAVVEADDALQLHSPDNAPSAT